MTDLVCQSITMRHLQEDANNNVIVVIDSSMTILEEAGALPLLEGMAMCCDPVFFAEPKAHACSTL